MDITTILFIAFGLSLDAFAVSVASGVIIRHQRFKRALTFGVTFGSFQMFMPIIGFATGRTMQAYVGVLDHWVAFVLLCGVGLKMIIEAVRIDEMEEASPDITGLMLLGLALATSIDSLAVGISFAFLQVGIVLPVVVIGVVTFLMSYAGVFIGNRFGGMFEKKVEFAGGLVLIAIGVKILLEHLKG